MTNDARISPGGDAASLLGGLWTATSGFHRSTSGPVQMVRGSGGLCYMPIHAAPPIDPLTVIEAFSPAQHNWLPAHRGVDLAARPTDTIRAVRAGSIVVAKNVAGRPVLVLKSRGVRFTFEPVTTRVAVGTLVRRGDAIGTVGSGGHCDGRCVHWGAKIGDRYVDPLGLLPRGSPVLKPVT